MITGRSCPPCSFSWTPISKSEANTLREAGVEYEFHRYPDAGHAFQNFPTPERYNETASEDAWVKVLEFLTKTLVS